jgi:uncharacterized protein YcfJ
MRSKLILAAMTAASATFVVPITPVAAQSYGDHYRDDRAYRGEDREYREHCKKSNGTTGLIAGGAGGALAGHALGGGTLGTVAGAVGGGLLGRHLDKKHDEHQNRENGC